MVLAPVVGGLLYGPLIYRFAREARGHGVPEVMLAVAEHGGRIRPQVAVVKSLASAHLHRLRRLGRPRGPDRSDRLGARLDGRPGAAAAGVTAAAAGRLRRGGRNLGHLQRADRRRLLRARADPARLRGRARSASSCSRRSSPTSIGRAAFGSAAFLDLPALPTPSRRLSTRSTRGSGVLAALVGVAVHPRPLRHRRPRRPALARPRVAAPGRRRAPARPRCCWSCPRCTASAIRCWTRAIHGHYAVWLLLAAAGRQDPGDQPDDRDRRLRRRLRAVAVHGRDARHRLRRRRRTICCRGSRRRPAPTASSAWGPSSPAPPARRSPPCIIIFELTGDYRIILPLMLAIVLATGVARSCSARDTIYTLKLRRRGIDLRAAAPPHPDATAHRRRRHATAPTPASRRRPRLTALVDRFADPRTARCRSSTSDGNLHAAPSPAETSNKPCETTQSTPRQANSP